MSEITEVASIKKKREICETCKRPKKVCWCFLIPKERKKISTKVIILQHPHENARAIQTAKMVDLYFNIENVVIYRGRSFGKLQYPGLFKEIEDPSNDVALLFPTNANELNDNYLSAKPNIIIVLDGTWSQAKGIYYRNNFLQSISKISLKKESENLSSENSLSEFVIRKQPNIDCVSTVEAVGRVLLQLENPYTFNVADYNDLVEPLRYVCQVQLSYGACVHDPKR